MQTNKQTSVSENTNKNTDWVLLAINKEKIIRRTNDYVLLQVIDYTAIVSSKFVRAKESDTHIYVSVPKDYKFTIKRTEINPTSHRYEVTFSKEVNSLYIKTLLKKDEKPE